MRDKRFLKYILILLLVPIVILLLIAYNKMTGKNDTAESEETPPTLDEIVEEFNEALAEDGETVDPEDFSDYQEEYTVEVNEDDEVNIQ